VTPVLFAILIGLVVGIIAYYKGRNFLLWWLYGAMIFPVALAHAIMLPVDPEYMAQKKMAAGMKMCSSCAEWIQQKAKICRFCQQAQTQEKVVDGEVIK
jgi:hypothetical protein